MRLLDLIRVASESRLASWVTASGLRFCLCLWLLHRLVVQGLGIVLVALLGPPQYARSGFFGTYFNWDSGWFACIAEAGYFGPACDSGGTSQRYAFFPLYPMLSRAVAWVIGLGTTISPSNITAAMWIVSALASLVAVIGLYSLVALDTNVVVARRAAAVLLFWPYSVFLVASYSESLYLACAITSWYFLRRRHYLLCGIVGAMATATRASGMFLVPALLVLYLTDTLRHRSTVRTRDLLSVAVSALGVLTYWLWLAIHTGDALAWSHAQSQYWNRRIQWPWQTLMRQVIHVLREQRWDWQVQAVLELLFAAAVCVGLLLLLQRRQWAALTLVGLTALSLMTSNSYLSFARNTLTMFPLMILLAQLTASDKHRRLSVGVMTVSVTLLIFNAAQLAVGNWAD